jgi:hypothetical protein
LQSLGLSLVGLFEHVDDLLQRVNTKLR